MAQFRLISLFVLSAAFVLSGCTKKEKTPAPKDLKISAVECSKQGKLLSSSGTACVEACGQNEVKDEKLNQCKVNHLNCGPNQVYRTGAGGILECQPRCPEDASFDPESGLCLCNFNDRPPRYDSENKAYCVPETCGSGQVKVGDKCEPISGPTCGKLGKKLSIDGAQCLDACPADQEVDENNQCKMKSGGGEECPAGQVKVGDKCEPISGPTCGKLGKKLSIDGAQCIDACPADQEVDANNQCQIKSSGPSPSQERSTEYEKAKADGKVIEPTLNVAIQLGSGVYAEGEVKKLVGGGDAYVGFESATIDLPSTIGGGNHIELSARNSVFAKRSGWVFLRQEMKPLPRDAGKTKVDPLKVKVYMGCLSNDCKKTGFKIVDESVQDAKEYYFEKSL